MSRRKRYTRNVGRKLRAPLPARTTVEWVRFEHRDEPYGVFSYVAEARPKLPVVMRAELDTLTEWFAHHLHAPPLEDDAEERFWFCAEADDCITRARRIAELVALGGIPIVERRTRRVPGKIRWQDPNQVCLLTYRDAPRPR